MMVSHGSLDRRAMNRIIGITDDGQLSLVQPMPPKDKDGKPSFVTLAEGHISDVAAFREAMEDHYAQDLGSRLAARPEASPR